MGGCAARGIFVSSKHVSCLILWYGFFTNTQAIKLYDDGRAQILQARPYHTISVISVQFNKLLLHGNFTSEWI